METLTTIGFDISQESSEICVIDRFGDVERTERIPTTKAGVTACFKRPRAHVVIEAGSETRWILGLLKELGHDVTVANPRHVKLISSGSRKSDKVDAQILARIGRIDRELLAPVEMRDAKTRGRPHGGPQP